MRWDASHTSLFDVSRRCLVFSSSFCCWLALALVSFVILRHCWSWLIVTVLDGWGLGLVQAGVVGGVGSGNGDVLLGLFEVAGFWLVVVGIC